MCHLHISNERAKLIIWIKLFESFRNYSVEENSILYWLIRRGRVAKI